MRTLCLVEDFVTSSYYHLARGDYSKSVKLQSDSLRFVNDKADVIHVLEVIKSRKTQMIQFF